MKQSSSASLHGDGVFAQPRAALANLGCRRAKGGLSKDLA